MAEFYKQVNGELVKCEYEKWFKDNKLYRYGTTLKEPYYSEDIPKCGLCGSELKIMKKGKSALILCCTNEECITNKTTYGDNKLKAFLPDEIYQRILEKRKQNKHSYYDKDYLINIKGLTEEEAEEYIIKHKKRCSEINKGKTNEYYKEKYGEEYVKNRTNKNKIKNKLCIEFWLNKGLTEEEGRKEISNIQSKNSKKVKNRKHETKEERIAKYGEKEAEKHFKERSHFCVEYWLKKGYTYEEATNNISDLQSNNSKKVKNRTSTKCVDYWLKKGYSKEEAKAIIAKSQSTFTLQKCIGKYGQENGLKKWKDRQNKWQKTLHDNKNLHVGFSNVSQELFNILTNFYDEEEKDYIFYGSKNREFTIRKNDKTYVYDFTDLKNRKIIEFNGDIYHGNPKLFNENDKPNPFKKQMTAKELWEFDTFKKQIAESEGFEELIIWENDYKNQKEQIIEQCKNFLLCKNQNKH